LKMNNKLITAFFALALSVSAFLMPMTAYAAGDSQAPTVTAELSGDMLHIEAKDNDSGVESIYVDGSRFNYLVDGGIDVNARDNHGNAEYISVYAVDFAGNKSASVRIKNPYYKAEAASTSPSPSQTIPLPNPTPAPSAPASATPAVPSTPRPTPVSDDTPESEASGPVTAPPSDGTEGDSSGQAPFTPDGTGTVMDNIVERNGKEFFTITTEAGNVFYLIVDRQSDSENVYLLNAVTEADLMALAEADGSGSSQSAIPVPTTPTPEPTEPIEPTPTPDPVPEEPKDDSAGSMIFIVIAVLAAGGAGYYFKILKPKKDAAAQAEDDMFGEDMEYEDDSEDEEYEETEDEPEYEEYPYEPVERESEETE